MLMNVDVNPRSVLSPSTFEVWYYDPTIPEPIKWRLGVIENDINGAISARERFEKSFSIVEIFRISRMII